MIRDENALYEIHHHYFEIFSKETDKCTLIV